MFINSQSFLDCPVGWHYSWYSNSCYNIYSYDVGITWPEANLKCTEQNGSLVSINSKQELEFVHLLVIKNINNIMDNKMLIGLFEIGYSLGFRFDCKKWTGKVGVREIRLHSFLQVFVRYIQKIKMN